MVNQVSIHLKLDTLTAHQLEQEVFVSGVNRNRLINAAVRLLIRYNDSRRRYGMAGRQREFIELSDKLNLT